MADDPRVPPHVIDAVMQDPTARRLLHLLGVSNQDLRTDLSGLMYVALVAFANLAPREPVEDQSAPDAGSSVSH